MPLREGKKAFWRCTVFAHFTIDIVLVVKLVYVDRGCHRGAAFVLLVKRARILK